MGVGWGGGGGDDFEGVSPGDPSNPMFPLFGQSGPPYDSGDGFQDSWSAPRSRAFQECWPLPRLDGDGCVRDRLSDERRSKGNERDAERLRRQAAWHLSPPPAQRHRRRRSAGSPSSAIQQQRCAGQTFAERAAGVPPTIHGAEQTVRTL